MAAWYAEFLIDPAGLGRGIWAVAGPVLQDPGGLTSLVASVFGVIAGAYLALTGLIRTVADNRERRLLDEITKEAEVASRLRRDLGVVRAFMVDYRVLAERLLVNLKLPNPAAADVAALEQELHRLDAAVVARKDEKP